jgi:hypothetical protein
VDEVAVLTESVVSKRGEALRASPTVSSEHWRPIYTGSELEVAMTHPVSARLALPVAVLLLLVSSGCEIAGGIFKAGFWIGAILAVIIVVGLVMLFRKA